jgi:predicted dehydrogenase
MEKVRVAIVGSEFAAGFHARALRRSPYTEIVAACSIDAPSLKRFVKNYNVPHSYDDYGKMFERDDIDLVNICVPNFLHKKVAIAALEAGKHVICEKPLATSVEDALAMVKAVRKSGLKFMYAEDWLSAPAIIRAKQIIDEGGIGRPLYIKAKETHNGSHSPFAQNKKTCGGGSMIHLAIHPMAFGRWLFGCEAVEVLGMTNGGGEDNFVHKNYGGEDWAAALLTYEGGQRAFIEGNYITHGGLDDFLEIYGSEGSIKIDLGFGSPMTVYSRPGYGYAVEKAETTLHWTKPAVDEEWNLGYVNEIAQFVDCVRLDQEPPWGLSVEDGAAVLQSIMAVYESAEKGRKVTLKPLFKKPKGCCCKSCK